MKDGYVIEAFSSTRVLCVGDVMLDRFIRGDIARISPEAPVPILRIQEEFSVLGGAGNVVRNLEALGAEVTFISSIGQDGEGELIHTLLKAFNKVKAYLIIDEARKTTTKTRFIASSQQILRTDQEQTFHLNKVLEAKLIKLFKEQVAFHDLVILSDYAKGIFSPKGLQSLIKEALAHGKPILVDPKGYDYTRYKGATLLTPNRNELALAAHSPTQSQEEVVTVAQNMIKDCNFSAMIITRGSEGMTLVEASGGIEHLRTQALEVFDVSGAGDTVIATLAVSLAAGASLSEAMFFANMAAGIVVAKIGTAVVHQDELLTTLHHQEIQDHEHKIVSWQKAQDKILKWKRRGQRIVFTNGCFDLLHPGHISLLKEAKKTGDRLIVGLNTDHSVQRLKGPTRPLQHEISRAFVLSSLEAVDLVVMFEEDTPFELIQTLKPDVLVKGADYTVDQVVGASFVQSYGGEVILVDLVDGESTTKIVSKMVA
ncbi:MAG: bifunctional D-glycero-beta-D-manno-heptose-7-phosphate kinase/D-glycero-beta-D-manno-heptose 1-phosphate adenylyltransferase HldE [Alphaproteobacteria bacterium]|nr:bifunctional D-glycero-beta-D-manno-heptose-7-phosphate kinase/D-glycero-beta-D-manno-heptose 1-phosphate adenylyltransferase HldE [Alphaproteobacteria bacterium]